jgi:hypothetical protein
MLSKSEYQNNPLALDEGDYDRRNPNILAKACSASDGFLLCTDVLRRQANQTEVLLKWTPV